MAFGELLREAREGCGYDLNQAARRLRIRPDILQAIEESDFDNMPPRGYTRNMVNAYAHLVGLNPTEITQMYLEEAYAHQVQQSQSQSLEESGFDMGSSSHRSSRSRDRDRDPAEDSVTRYERSSYGSGSSSRGRTGSASPSRTMPQEGVRVNRHTSSPSSEYTNFYAASSSSGSATESKTPYVIAVIAVVVLLIVVLVLAFGCSSQEEDDSDVANVPITGMTDTTVTDEGSGEGESDESSDESTTTETAPTSVEFSYEVLDGEEAYIEVYLDDEGASTAATISGPSEESFEVTGTLKFVTTNPDGVVATVDGEEVEPEDQYGKGVYTYTVDFSEILAEWEEENGVSSSDDESDEESEEDSEESEDTEEETVEE